MTFKEFMKLDEVGTSTADVAGFSRICIPLTRRMWPNEKSKKTYRVPQLDESDETVD